MTNPRRTATRAVTVATAVALGATMLGCGMIQNAVDTANALSEFSDRLGKASSLTYTAEYAYEGETVTLVQQPPKAAVLTGDGRLITTPEAMIMCDGTECQSAPSAGTTDPSLVAGVAGPGFLTPELALGLVAAAAIVPGTDVSTSEREIAGQDALCADVTGIEDPSGAAPGDMRNFTVCVTGDGVLASFVGETQAGEKASIELTSFSTKVDKNAFQPPKGANVVDVTALTY